MPLHDMQMPSYGFVIKNDCAVSKNVTSCLHLTFFDQRITISFPYRLVMSKADQ
jgi:hypothetical protein